MQPLHGSSLLPWVGKASESQSEPIKKGAIVMSIFKRGNVYWFHFLHEGRHIQKSTGQGNPRVARQMEAAVRTRLAKEGVGIQERKCAPLFPVFAKRFLEHVQVRHNNKPQTVDFYAAKLSRLLQFPALASVRLDQVDESLIE